MKLCGPQGTLIHVWVLMYCSIIIHILFSTFPHAQKLWQIDAFIHHLVQRPAASFNSLSKGTTSLQKYEKLSIKKSFATRMSLSKRITAAEYVGAVINMQKMFSISIVCVPACVCFRMWAVSNPGYTPIYNWLWRSCIRTQQHVTWWKTDWEMQGEKVSDSWWLCKCLYLSSTL